MYHESLNTELLGRLLNYLNWVFLKRMIVSATELANESKSVLDRVVQGGEVVEVQRHGKTVAVIHPKVGATRSELLRLLRGRGFSAEDFRDLKRAMDAASQVIGYAGRD
jgi:prevent-host-death family protein